MSPAQAEDVLIKTRAGITLSATVALPDPRPEGRVPTILVFDIYTHYVAWLAFIHLCIAGAAVYKVTGKWLWNIGGFEYCLFWAIACAVVAMMTPA